MGSKYKYTTSFLQPIIASADIDQKNIKISKASMDDLKTLMPDSINLDKNIDLVGVAFNAAVVNKFNKNHDGISTDTALAVKDYFVHKPTNIEHKKQRIVGHIVSAGFSSYGDNEILTRFPSIQKAKELLNYEPKIKLEEIILDISQNSKPVDFVNSSQSIEDT